jgi:uncharacterized protein YdeI (YjbR/CyaY-like superfamily)
MRKFQYQLKLKQFWDKKNDPAWRKAKEYDDAIVYTLKEKVYFFSQNFLRIF